MMTEQEKQHAIEAWEARWKKGKAIVILRTVGFYFVGLSVVAILIDWTAAPFSEALSINLAQGQLLSNAILSIILGLGNYYLTDWHYRLLKKQP